MTLSKASGAAGMFNTLANGAVVKNFTIIANTSDAIKTTTPVYSLYFGGVVGQVNAGVSVSIENITVKGLLEFSNHSGSYICVGGLIGGMNWGGTPGTINIDNCVSELAINIKNSESTTGSQSAGGLIGLVRQIVNMNNCYTTGKIEVKKTSAGTIAAGGLVGMLSWSHDAATLNIKNCYTAGEVIVDGTASTGVNSAGGLVGMHVGVDANLDIQNSAALNPKVLVIVNEGAEANARYGRLVGGTGTLREGTQNFQNNIASENMLIGPTAAGGGTAADVGINSVGGLTVTATALRNAAATWTGGGSTLKWDDAIWDFSNLAAEWPTLK